MSATPALFSSWSITFSLEFLMPNVTDILLYHMGFSVSSLYRSSASFLKRSCRDTSFLISTFGRYRFPWFQHRTWTEEFPFTVPLQAQQQAAALCPACTLRTVGWKWSHDKADSNVVLLRGWIVILNFFLKCLLQSVSKVTKVSQPLKCWFTNAYLSLCFCDQFRHTIGNLYLRTHCHPSKWCSISFCHVFLWNYPLYRASPICQHNW